MKQIFFIILIFFSFCYCKGKEREFIISDSVKIQLKESMINANEYFKNYENTVSASYIYFIDSSPVFGTDFELPTSKLDYANVIINGEKYELDVFYMYNPNLDMCKLKTIHKDNIFVINAKFSDGAGTYVAQWIIFKNKSIRTIISNEESIIISLFP